MKIIATTDGSPRAGAVVPHAARLAGAVGGELLLMRVLSPLIDCSDVRAVSLEEAVEVVSRRWSSELGAMLEGLGAPGRGIVELRRSREEIHDAILRVASSEGAGLVAMGSRGAGVVRHAVLGSVALHVLGMTKVPLLIAGEAAAPPVPGDRYHILATTDGSDDAARAVEAAMALAADSRVTVTLLTVHVPRLGDGGDAAAIEEAGELLAGLRGRFPEPSRVATVVASAAMPQAVDSVILDTAAELGASAIAISTHGHSAAYHAFLGSTALAILGRSELPLVLVRSGPANGS